MTAMGLRAAWEVRTGLLPGTAMPEFTKQWFYTSDDFEKDRESTEPINIFTSKLKEAYEYAAQMTDPAHINWVDLSFIWY
jgi:hypothetical protein